MITFPKAKNDQFHKGRSSFLNTAPGDPYCPVTLVKGYFRRFDLKFGMEAADSSFVNFQLRRQVGGLRAIKTSSLSASGATDALRAAGCPDAKISGKSVKMAGVMAAYAAGALSTDVIHAGCWQTEEMPLRYKLNSYAFKKTVAAKIPRLSNA
jgi:hypothetical protein